MFRFIGRRRRGRLIDMTKGKAMRAADSHSLLSIGEAIR